MSRIKIIAGVILFIFLFLYFSFLNQKPLDINDLKEQKQEIMAQEQEELQALQSKCSQRQTWYENRINKLERMISKAEETKAITNK